jgi:hypothetical protein
MRTIWPGEHVDRDSIEHGRSHLTGNRALPDKRIQAVQIIVELAFYIGRRDGRRRGTYRFVRFLCVLRLRLVDADFFRDGILTVQFYGRFTDLLHGFGREGDGVGTHISDETDVALADVDAFI